MQTLDWIVLFGTLFLIVAYGTWATRREHSLNSYLRGGNSLNWFTVGLSVMATQASAITFLSAPGLGFESGMRFVQFYLGLPIALVLVSIFFIPVYFKSGVYTAYEYLEKRFDIRVRLFTASLFLISRGLAAGLTIFAPAIILSTLLQWNLTATNIFVGVLVIVYTTSGGAKAVSITQKWQMSIILLGMFLAGAILFKQLSENMNFGDMLAVAGATGRMEVIDFSFDWNERYTFWSGISGGLFLMLSYFGTDQSQVQRYISASDIKQSRMGLMFNAVLKIPMQFLIVFIGVLVFLFYTYEKPPIFFNQDILNAVAKTEYQADLEELQTTYDAHWNEFSQTRDAFLAARKSGANTAPLKNQLSALNYREKEIRKDVATLLKTSNADHKVKDTNYVFLTFVMTYLPAGIVGLLLAVIFSAAMSSTAGELSALTSTSCVDYYQRLINPNASEKQLYYVSKGLTLFWGAMAILFAVYASLFDNLIEMVNVLGSLFYGTILGIFLVAFALKKIGGKAVLFGGIAGQLSVLFFHVVNTFAEEYNWGWADALQIEYLWYNVIGTVVVIGVSLLVHYFSELEKNKNLSHPQ
ncbi:MAG: sodium:solute symporter [Schleiferiaceae bacterium]|nr:sodium:solute symporter [Schleiferiaceae bacterium]